MPKLTKVTPTTIKAIKPADKPVKWGVGDGLYIYVTPQGYKSWRYKYRFMNKEKVLVIGDALAISYEEAKAARLAAINNITHGIVKLTSAKCKIPNFILTLMHSTDFGLWSAMNPNCV